MIGWVINGGNRGSAIVPSDPDSSLLIQAVSYADKALKMPRRSNSRGASRRFERMGQEWRCLPQVELPEEIGKSAADYKQLKREHWAFQPLSEVSVPQVSDEGWRKTISIASFWQN